jgi:hypothetical protein
MIIYKWHACPGSYTMLSIFMGGDLWIWVDLSGYGWICGSEWIWVDLLFILYIIYSPNIALAREGFLLVF